MRITLAAAAALLIAAPRAHAQYAGAMGQTIDGISCDASEGSRIHIHQHLVIMDHGHPVSIPSTIGQVPARQCIYWLHTHTPDGIIHIEAPKDRSFVLGDFFKVWGQPITKTQIGSARVAKKESMRVYVDGKRYMGDPAGIKLKPHADIYIEVGAPFAKVIPQFTNWGSL